MQGEGLELCHRFGHEVLEVTSFLFFSLVEFFQESISVELRGCSSLLITLLVFVVFCWNSFLWLVARRYVW
jgi:hypothetical protein